MQTYIRDRKAFYACPSRQRGWPWRFRGDHYRMASEAKMAADCFPNTYDAPLEPVVRQDGDGREKNGALAGLFIS